MNAAAWLVDIGYVVKASEGRFKLDYARTEELLRARLGALRCFLFNGFDSRYGIPTGLQAFYTAMRHRKMEVRLHPMAGGAPGSNRQRRVDVDLCAHLVWQASLPHVTSLVVTTGDQDFVPALEVARERFGKPVTLFTYRASVHADLAAAADEHWTFEDHEAQVARDG